MDTLTSEAKLLFVINAASGSTDEDYRAIIRNYFEKKLQYAIYYFECQGEQMTDRLANDIKTINPQVVVAVGGDGTVKLVATLLVNTTIKLAVIPTGSANGLAKELNIPLDPVAALDTVCQCPVHNIHLIKVNDHYCIHLSDIGFNAYVVKTFEKQQQRGMWGYVKAAWKVLWRHAKLEAQFEIDGNIVKRTAVMIVLANATRYGNGVTINPAGKLDDNLFEIIIVRKISLIELFKMRFLSTDFNSNKTEVYQVRSAQITSRKKAHFQVDGEYLGKVRQVNASIRPEVLQVIYPRSAKD